MVFDYGISYDETNRTLHVLRPEEYLKIHLAPFHVERFDLNCPEKGFQVCFPSEIDFHKIRGILYGSLSRHDFNKNTIQVFFPHNTLDQESAPELVEQRQRASLFNLWKFWSMLNKRSLWQALRFRELHVKLFYVFERCPGMLDLAVSNPGLVFYMILKHDFAPGKLDETVVRLRCLSSMKQRDIAISIGLRPEIIPVLKRIHPRSLSEKEFVRFVESLRRKHSPKYLHHLQVINLSHLKIMADEDLRYRVSAKYMIDLTHVRKDIYTPFTADMLKWIVDMCCELKISAPQHINSEQHLDHFIIKYPYLLGYDSDTLGTELPSPPIRSEPHIKALDTAIAIMKEGHEMSNCLSAQPYLDAIRNGAYLYRILDRYGIKDRATLLISPEYNKDIKRHIYLIQEIKGKFNEPIKISTIKTVEDWLLTAQNLHDPNSIKMIQEFRFNRQTQKNDDKYLFIYMAESKSASNY